MDCLTGYGSDSDESSSCNANNAVSGGDNQGAKVASLSSLLGTGIDSCPSSSDDDDQSPKQRKQSHPSGSTSKNAVDIDHGCQEQTKKKQRIHEKNSSTDMNQAKIHSFVRNRLPSPKTAQSASMISWKTDYISKETRSPPAAAHSANRRQFETFKKIAFSQSYDTKKGWAAHLRNQNEFHNPHFIQSVIDQFGIIESLGSQAVGKTKSSRRSRFN